MVFGIGHRQSGADRWPNRLFIVSIGLAKLNFLLNYCQLPSSAAASDLSYFYDLQPQKNLLSLITNQKCQKITITALTGVLS
jgi:hypothetical protein